MPQHTPRTPRPTVSAQRRMRRSNPIPRAMLGKTQVPSRTARSLLTGNRSAHEEELWGESSATPRSQATQPGRSKSINVLCITG